MCNENMRGFLQALPKCEHHLHLEGALTPAVLFRLAANNSITLPAATDPAYTSPSTLEQRYLAFTSLDDFLHYYYIGMSVLIHAKDFEALAWDYFQHAHADGVMHAEVFFDPQAHLERGIAYNVVLEGVMAARKRAQEELGISSELICCFLRHLPVPNSLETFAREDVRGSFARGDVVGIGIDSSELPFPPELFQEVYRDAKALGLRRTAHAGEEGPATYIADAVDKLHVERIDHGIRLAEDPALMKRLAQTSWKRQSSHEGNVDGGNESGMGSKSKMSLQGSDADDSGNTYNQPPLLTICPISNVFLKCVTSVADLPIRRFLDAGIRFSLNSDDPAYFGNNFILANYCAVQDAFNLSVDEWAGICANAIRGSWCSPARKVELEQLLKGVLDDWRPRLSAVGKIRE